MSNKILLQAAVTDTVLDDILKQSEMTKYEFTILAAAEFMHQKGKFCAADVELLLEKRRHDLIYKAMKKLVDLGVIERINEKKVYYGQTNTYTVTGKGVYWLRKFDRTMRQKLDNPVPVPRVVVPFVNNKKSRAAKRTKDNSI